MTRVWQTGSQEFTLASKPNHTLPQAIICSPPVPHPLFNHHVCTHFVSLSTIHSSILWWYIHTHTHAHAHTHNVLFCYNRTWMWTRPQEARQRCCFKNAACIWRRMIGELHMCEAKHLDGLLTLGCGAGHELHPLQWYQEGRGPKRKFIVHRITQILPRNVILGSSNDTGVSSSVCFDSWTFLTFEWMGIWVRPQSCSTTTCYYWEDSGSKWQH